MGGVFDVRCEAIQITQDDKRAALGRSAECRKIVDGGPASEVHLEVVNGVLIYPSPVATAPTSSSLRHVQ